MHWRKVLLEKPESERSFNCPDSKLLFPFVSELTSENAERGEKENTNARNGIIECFYNFQFNFLSLTCSNKRNQCSQE